MKEENIPQAEFLTKFHFNLTETKSGHSSDPGVVRRSSFLQRAGKKHDIDMNHFQKLNPEEVRAKAKRVSDSQTRSRVKPTMKQSLIVIALVTVAVSQSAAIGANSISERVNLKNSQPRETVWIEKGAHKANVDSNGVILKGYDPVAYFTQHKAVKGTRNYQTTYQGAIYYFSSAADLTAFKKNPSHYAPQFGAFCANGVKNKALRDSDPTVFFIIKGKLYVCASTAAEKEFRSKEDEDVITAQRNWYQLIE
jgi:YHS domain-containing protein